MPIKKNIIESIKKADETESPEEKAQASIAYAVNLTLGAMEGAGCYRDDDGNIENYMVSTYSKAADKKGKLIWSNFIDRQMGNEAPMWEDVQSEMWRRGIDLAFAVCTGWYIGAGGERGLFIGQQFNYTLTKITNLDKKVNAIFITGENRGEIEEYIKRTLKHDVPIGKLLKGLQAAYSVWEVPHQLGFAILLLDERIESD